MRSTLTSKLLAEIHKDTKTAPKLIAVNFEVTARCNLLCKHCYASACPANCIEQLSTVDIKRFISDIKKHFGTKIIVQITGGEPLVRSDLFEILAHIRSQGFEVGLATNGTLLNHSLAVKLKELTSSVSVSLDGTRESHNRLRNSDCYNQAVKGVKLLSEVGHQNISIKTVVNKLNLHELGTVLETIKKFSVSSWHLIPFEPQGRGKENKNLLLNKSEYIHLCDFIDQTRKSMPQGFRVFFEEQPESMHHTKTTDWPKYKKCTAGISHLSVLASGDIVSCLNCGQGAKPEGNIKRDDIGRIWQKGFQNNRKMSYTYCDNHYYLRNKKGNKV